MTSPRQTTILAIGDPHFQVTNIPDVELFIDRLEAFAISRKPDYIVCLGDLLHTHETINTMALNKAYEFIKRMRDIAPTLVLIGNHDFIGNQQFLTENHWMNAMKEWKGVTIVDTLTHVITKRKEHLVFCPYVPVGRFREALNTSDRDWPDASIIFPHQEFFGCK